ncbi:hypothetical protein EV356DRAFT_110701 [Viridothelium virens]|uniref:Uncharacterized protein n=1 Tax=Viridothelium virens TaxID=1048519 RepID=A0A6A6HPI6_VIRVR|nr:hypothetical protein EV356DRAFT_110701 [Viridothelium virens]
MLLPRRFQAIFALIFLVLVSLVLFNAPPSRRLEVSGLAVPKLPDSIPLPRNPFGPLSHKPPEEQANSTAGETHWYTDWKWRNPFSSAVTLDENRAVLPPQPPRPYIYTFYDTATKKDEETEKAEHELLLTWRRAWWAQDFKPIILGRSEAMNNQLYGELQRLELRPELEVELARMLAWGNMGSGILADWLTYPMADPNDAILSFLRRGEFPDLLAFEGLRSSLLCGEKAVINQAVKDALNHPDIRNAKDLLEVLPSALKLESQPNSIAVYDVRLVAQTYSHIANTLQNANPEFHLSLLPQLINSHLHTTWQSSFPKGINILIPLNKDPITALHAPLIDLARNLTQCPATPIPSSCPPNNPKCQPCVATRPLSLNIISSYKNDSDAFTLGIVPHPYTMYSLIHRTPTLTTRLVRRSSARNPWLTATTLELIGHGPSAATRILRFKDAVASSSSSSSTSSSHPTSLWLTPEPYYDSSASSALPHDIGSDAWQHDLDWHFGFVLPRAMLDTGRRDPPVPGSAEKQRPPPPKALPKAPSREEVAAEREILEGAAQVVVQSGSYSPLEIAKGGVRALEGVEYGGCGGVAVCAGVECEEEEGEGLGGLVGLGMI